MVVAAPDAASHQRFEILGNLGKGGMGVVYRAFDHRLRRPVALKLLRKYGGRDLYRFKREFRSIADLVHPNLVMLHELHTSGDQWFISMELIDGVSFIEWVRPATSAKSGHDDPTEDAARQRPSQWPAPRQAIVDACLDEEKLRAALAQLVDGVLALHISSKLHRDLKPSNVLVDRGGRIVILDFGLVSDVDRMSAEHTHEKAAVGTPAYMSPEQAGDAPLSEASDWYAVGAMLYEALTGRRPFEGTPEEILRQKQTSTPVPPRSLVPSVSADLDELCLQLLAREPARRPDGRAILTSLGSAPSQATTELERANASRPFIGRERELEALHHALADSRNRGVTVFLGGESGIGKSQLVHHFLEQISGKALVLEGRCFERESVPFRTLDGVIDALTNTLLRLPEAQIARLMSRDVTALAHLFPVLRRVPAVADSAVTIALPPSPEELRRRAFEALRGLFAGLSVDQPLVVAIDDLQWGDADSAVFLAEIAHRPEPFLLLLVHRPEQEGGAGGIVKTVRSGRSGVVGGDIRTIAIEPLPEEDARRLALALGIGERTSDSVVREAGGHPLFLAELARTAGHRGDAAASLDELIQGRVSALPEPAAALLRTAAVAARPLPLDHAIRATLMAGGEGRLLQTMVGGTPELSLLRAERLARIRVDDSDTRAIEPYHDRIRAAVVGAMNPAELRTTHEALARAYEDAGDSGDREALAAHWLAAGHPGRAAGYAIEAASAAEAALAFHRAADLYALALAHGTPDPAARGTLHQRHAEALTSAGRLDEAAAAFAEAAAGAPPEQALIFEQRRLEQILRRGRLAEGLELSRRLLAQLGVRLPSTRAAVIRNLAGQLLLLRLRGLTVREQPAGQTAPELLRTIDLLFSISTGLAMHDPITGRLIQCHYVRTALDAGEPLRACSALAIELGYLASYGTRAVRRVDALSARVRDLAERTDDPYVRGRATTMRGFAFFLTGRWRDAAVLTDAGLRRMREDGVGVRWDFDVIELVHLSALFYLGETREVARLAPQRLRDAAERGDVIAPGDLRGGRGNIAWLILGKPDEARGNVAAVEVPWPAAGDDLQMRHFEQLRSHTQIDLYLGDGAGASARLERAWPAIQTSQLLRVQLLRIETRFLRARVALAAAIGTAEHGRQIKLARRLARQLDREHAPWASAFATQIRATVAMIAGDTAAAETQLAEAERAYAACEMSLYAAVMRLRRGTLEGGASGTSRAAAARATLREQGIADPDAMARLLCPWPEA